MLALGGRFNDAYGASSIVTDIPRDNLALPGREAPCGRTWIEDRFREGKHGARSTISSADAGTPRASASRRRRKPHKLSATHGAPAERSDKTT